MNSIRTIIVDDERYACERLRKLLAPFSQIQIVDCVTNCQEALSSILNLKPELVFLDVELGNNVSAFDLMKKIESTAYHPYIIIVTGHSQYSIKAIKYKVFDYIMKPVDIDELEDTIDRLIEDKSFTPKEVECQFPMLSEREQSVLKHVLEGKNSKEIADCLFISINTVHTHRRNILKKTGASSILNLIRLGNVYSE